MGQFLAIGLVTEIGINKSEADKAELTLEQIQERMQQNLHYASVVGTRQTPEESFQFDEYGMRDYLTVNHTDICVSYDAVLLSMKGKISMETYGRQFTFVKYYDADVSAIPPRRGAAKGLIGVRPQFWDYVCPLVYLRGGKGKKFSPLRGHQLIPITSIPEPAIKARIKTVVQAGRLPTINSILNNIHAGFIYINRECLADI